MIDMKKTCLLIAGCLLINIGIVRGSELSLIESGICEDVINHRAVNISEVFERNIGRLFCFTRVQGPYYALNEQSVTHVWYHGDSEQARVTLPVKSSNWGTHSSKKIQSRQVGAWRVEILDSKEAVIGMFPFQIR